MDVTLSNTVLAFSFHAAAWTTVNLNMFQMIVTENKSMNPTTSP